MTLIAPESAQNQGVWSNHFNSGSGGEADSQENDSFWHALSAQSSVSAQPSLAKMPGAQPTQSAGVESVASEPKTEDDLGLDDFVDIINPLHHIPVISTLYRELSGDQIVPAARLAGGTLYGGPIGAGVAVANIAVEAMLGQDIGASVLAAFDDDSSSTGQPNDMVAKASDLPVAAPQPHAPAPTEQAPAMKADAEPVARSSLPNVNASKLDAFMAKHAQKAGKGFDPADIRAEPRYPGPASRTAGSAPAQAPMPPIPGASSDPKEISNWMMRTLDQYQHMKQGQSPNAGETS